MAGRAGPASQQAGHYCGTEASPAGQQADAGLGFACYGFLSPE